MHRLQAFMGRAAQTLLDIIATLSGAYYSGKYAALTRRLGLPRLAASERRGFVIIQIDGLAHPYLQTALEQGYAPYIQRLLRRGGYTLHCWRTGLPSSTPAAQAGIMFGGNDDIPAFRWYDKETEQAVVCKLPGTLRAIRERLPNRGHGLLVGGSSLMNMFDGDASLSMFTVGAFHRKRFFENVRGAGFLLLFVLNPFRSFKVFLFSIWEYLVDLVQHTHATLRNQFPRPLEATFPFLRVLSNVVLREIQTFAVMVDIYRGVSSIYTTYYGYDELAHSYGPTSRTALRALRAIDARIRQIDTLRRMGFTRSYDLYILSDHGMTPALPFRHAYGQTLGEFIHQVVGQTGVNVSETGGAGWTRATVGPMYLADELVAIEQNTPASLAHIPRKLRQLVAARIARQPQDEELWSTAQPGELIVRNSGPMSHVYFSVTPKQMDLSEIAAFCPDLVSRLLAHEGIGWVMGREMGQVYLMSKQGLAILDAGYTVEGTDPLESLPRPQLAAAQLQRLAHFPHAGDLIIMGSYSLETGICSCFEPQWACHGGMGGAQELAFMLKPSHLAWDVDSVTQANEIYGLFAGQYPLGPQDVGPEESSPCR